MSKNWPTSDEVRRAARYADWCLTVPAPDVPITFEWLKAQMLSLLGRTEREQAGLPQELPGPPRPSR